MKVLFALLLLTSAAWAQEPTYHPPDQELWQQMSQAFSQINMPLTSHQQVQQIMMNVQAEAAKRAAAQKK